MFLRQFIQARNLYSLHQLTLNKTLKLQVPKSCYFFNVRFNSNEKNDATKVESRKSEEERKVAYIRLELSLLHEQGKRVPDPDLMKQEQWDELLKFSTKSARQRYYKALFELQVIRANEQIKKLEAEKLRAHIKSLEPVEEAPETTYGLGKTSFLIRINDSALNIWRNNRLREAMQFGDKIIYDCSYDQHMNSREQRNTAKQLMFAFANNRKNREPFDLHFCNVNFNSLTMKTLERHIPTMRNKAFPLHLHQKSYLDIFPKEKLVYLTPDCQNTLTEYDPNMIYIIGALVDKGNQEMLALAKAKQLGIKMARLPLDKYLQWGSGGHSLTLDQMINIMLVLKKTRSWVDALKQVPSRKVVGHHVCRRYSDTSFTRSVTRYQSMERIFNDDTPTLAQSSTNNTLSTADKFRIGRRIPQNNTSPNPFKGNDTTPTFSERSTDNKMSTADKFRLGKRIPPFTKR